jgi:hypothetical protein
MIHAEPDPPWKWDYDDCFVGEFCVSPFGEGQRRGLCALYVMMGKGVRLVLQIQEEKIN